MLCNILNIVPVCFLSNSSSVVPKEALYVADPQMGQIQIYQYKDLRVKGITLQPFKKLSNMSRW